MTPVWHLVRRALRRCPFALVMLASSAGLPVPAAEVTIKTSTGDGADAEVRENANNSGHDAGRGDDEKLNVRYDPSEGKERNEVGLLRFDLTGVDPAALKNARLELTVWSKPGNENNLKVYGLKPSVAKQKWNEFDTRFSNAPGLKWDDNFKTRGLVEEDVVTLGKIPFPSAEPGAVLKLESPELTSFLQDKAISTRSTDPNLVTLLLLLDTENAGQRRIRSKEFMDENDADAPRLIITTDP